MEMPVTDGLDQDRPAVPADVIDRPLRRLAHGERIHAVDFQRRHAETQAAAAQARFACLLAHMGRHRIQVVLDKENRRAIVQRRQIERLQRRSHLRRAIAEKRYRDIVTATVLVGKGIADRVRRVAADNGVGAETARLGKAQMHGATAATAKAGLQPHDLGQCLLDHAMHVRARLARARVVIRGHRPVEHLGEELMMHAVGAVDLIAGAQHRHAADRAPLLPDARMRRSVQELLAFELQHLFLEHANDLHLLEHPRQHSGIVPLPIGLGRHEPGPDRLGGEWLEFGHVPTCRFVRYAAASNAPDRSVA